MISTFVTLIRANSDVHLKVPGMFCLYRDPNKLPRHEVLSSDVPYFIEIEYTDDDFPNTKMAYASHSFDYGKKKIDISGSKKQPVSKDILRSEYLTGRKNEIEALLLPFMGIFVFSYPHVQGWFLELNGVHDNMASKYGQLHFLYNGKIEEPDTLYQIENERYFSNPTVLVQRDKVSGDWVWDIKLTDMFEAFYNAPESIKKAVLRATRQYHKSESLFHIDPIARFLYQVYAIETMIDTEYSNSGNKIPVCEHCGQKKFAVRQKFHAFVKKYFESYNKKDIDKIYELRSAIVHSGEVLFQPSFFLYDDSIKEFEKKYLNERTLQIASQVVKETINKFLFLNSNMATKLK